MALKITAGDLARLNLIDGIIPEAAGGAQEDYDKAAFLLGQTLIAALNDLRALTPDQLIEQRYERLRQMGNFFEESQLA